MLGMYARALPVLHAERQLHMVNAVKLGFADSDDANVRSALRDLEIAARGGRQVPAAKPTAATFAQLGIPIETFE